MTPEITNEFLSHFSQIGFLFSHLILKVPANLLPECDKIITEYEEAANALQTTRP